MGSTSEKITEKRMDEALGAELENDKEFWKQGKKLQGAMKDLRKAIEEKRPAQKKTLETIDDAIADYMYIYGKAAYRLGYSDGILTGAEKGNCGRKTVFTLEDMYSMVVMYDAVKKLNITMLGSMEARCKEEGVLGAIDRVCDVIVNGAGAEIKLQEEDEAAGFIERVLDDTTKTAQERARLLLGMGK